MNYITIFELCNYVEELENVCISKQIGKGTSMTNFLKKDMENEHQILNSNFFKKCG